MSSHPRRRILIIARSLPEPADDGYRIRVRALALGLVEWDDVTLVGLSDGDDSAAIATLAGLGIEAYSIPAPHHATSLRRARRLATGRPWLTRSAEQVALRSLIARLAADHRFDLVQIESSEFAGLPLPPSAPLVIDEHNVWSELTARRRALRRPGPRGALDRFESRQLVATEDRAWSSAAGVIFCSEREADGARRRVPGGRIAAIPNGVDLAAFQPEPAASEARHQEAGLLTFVGLLRYTPNADAVRWFVRDILPLVRRQEPSARFEAVGKTPSPAVVALAADDVRIVGSVPDVRPFLARASVVVVPLRAGSGTRIKILEALAMGKAVVTTSIGCEGLAVRDGVHLLVADDRESFAAATARLLAVPELRARLGAAGRALVERDYSWSTSVDRLARFHDEILGDVDATDADAGRGLGA